jgi:chorismate-pyruvate lyase
MPNQINYNNTSSYSKLLDNLGAWHIELISCQAQKMSSLAQPFKKNLGGTLSYQRKVKIYLGNQLNLLAVSECNLNDKFWVSKLSKLESLPLGRILFDQLKLQRSSFRFGLLSQHKVKQVFGNLPGQIKQREHYLVRQSYFYHFSSFLLLTEFFCE